MPETAQGGWVLDDSEVQRDRYAAAPERPKWCRHGKYNDCHDSDTGEFCSDPGSGGIPATQDSAYPPDNPHDLDSGLANGPVWAGKVQASGLAADLPKATYDQWEQGQGFGPCGVYSAMNRQDYGWPIATTNAQVEVNGKTQDFPHFVNIGPDGAIIDGTNPFPGPLRYTSVVLLSRTELPDLVNAKAIKDLRKLVGRRRP